GSMATRETSGTIYTHAGPEIGVASTKAFTSQLVALYLLAVRLGQIRGVLSTEASRSHIDALLLLPQFLETALKLHSETEEIAARFYNRTDFLYLGRGINYPIALEGALKLKEISYIDAEGYPAGEMKHGPIALIDRNLPVIALVFGDTLYEKMMVNIEEARARDGAIIAVTYEGNDEVPRHADRTITVPRTSDLLSPILAIVPLQLLAYHIALRRGCDVGQPRHLVKSVTVE